MSKIILSRPMINGVPLAHCPHPQDNFCIGVGSWVGEAVGAFIHSFIQNKVY